MDVEEMGVAGAGDRETVANSGRHRDPGAGPCTLDFVADRELDLSLEDVERVGVILVDVRFDRPEARLAPELEHLELAALVLDPKLAAPTRELLARARA